MGLLTTIIDGLHWLDEKISLAGKAVTIVLFGVITIDIFIGANPIPQISRAIA